MSANRNYRAKKGRVKKLGAGLRKVPINFLPMEHVHKYDGRALYFETYPIIADAYPKVAPPSSKFLGSMFKKFELGSHFRENIQAKLRNAMFYFGFKRGKFFFE